MPGASFKAPAPSSITSTSTVPSPRLPRDPPERQRSLELERWLDCELGERVRRVFYFHALNHRDLVVRLFTQGGPWWGRLICRVGFPMIANRIRQMYEITPENVALDMDRVTAAYERLDTLLANCRRQTSGLAVTTAVH